jgi:hypothetical protein
MALSSARWNKISESQFPWERDALDYIRERLPNQEPYRAWSNFEFVADDGSINEVDLAVLSPAGFFLIEVKSKPGTLAGDVHTWIWKEGPSQGPLLQRALKFHDRISFACSVKCAAHV